MENGTPFSPELPPPPILLFNREDPFKIIEISTGIWSITDVAGRWLTKEDLGPVPLHLGRQKGVQLSFHLLTPLFFALFLRNVIAYSNNLVLRVICRGPEPDLRRKVTDGWR